jgi:hypothetical protein
MTRTLAALMLVMLACPSHADSFTLPFKGFSVNVPVEGRQVELKVSGTATAADKGDALDVNADLTVNLADLRKQIGDIVRAKVNRNDDCGDKLDAHTVDLIAAPPIAKLTASAHYERWLCVLGAKTKIEQDGDVALELTPVVAGDTINVDVKLAEMHGNGVLEELLRDNIFGPWLVDQLRTLLPKSLTIANLRDGLPPALRDVPATLEHPSIVDAGGGTPAIRCTLHITVPAEKVPALLQQLQKQ